MKSTACDILVVGGSLGGVAAALAATEIGFKVVLTEETDWIGGQLTAQGVPADEHSWIERCGCTNSYRQLRSRIRAFYSANYPLSDMGQASAALNPGLASVSAIAHEPRVARLVLEGMLAPKISGRQLTLWTETKPVRVERVGAQVRAVEFRDLSTGAIATIHARFVIDATELGDLLALAEIPFVTGSEGQKAHGEMHEPHADPRPDNMQAITWVAALGYDPKCEAQSDQYKIDRPSTYEFWREYVPLLQPAWTGRLLSWDFMNPFTMRCRRGGLLEHPGSPAFSFWRYRRILAGNNFKVDPFWHEASMVNWPQNDYLEGEIINGPKATRDERLLAARELTLSLVYWLQNHAERPDGGEGHGGIYLRPDVVGTRDGLAKYPYIREARRIRINRPVTEGDIGFAARGGRRPDPVKDSVGVGYYRIDLHPSTGGDNYIDVESFPFQIPLRSLVPQGVDNLLPAAKNIGVTHITNGCFRLHPVEWGIGEAAGVLASFCLQHLCTADHVLKTPRLLEGYQKVLQQMGVMLTWPEYVYEEHLRAANGAK